MDVDQLGRALGLFSTLSPTHLPVHFVQTFLIVAEHDGPCTFRTIEQALDLTNSSVSRTVAALGQAHRRGHDGFDLVTVQPDPDEGRRLVVTLTTKGKALHRQLKSLK
ncbi:transcriptional regulator [uncultured phage_MedDCM-OCT-S38-C3]|uniref:Transcriptional regulators (MarR) n=1 Tax=uncultured phage_MedDCM-OCT-S38-C3 TaxID=2740803 RepID=A0A6S4P8N9_9CAUD|nr:transcriptional regulator [uncultured phage_MedDCM-OCT-S38-C3]BAQ94459.1 Transcriptional regulators (MarR) [uncultured phage_MedDCM-OCT-S38-C3]